MVNSRTRCYLAIVLWLSLSYAPIVLAWKPHPGWRDSYGVDGICYCDTTNFDHGIGDKTVLSPDGYRRSVRQVCADIRQRYGEGAKHGRIPYNTIACGHGPANDAADEDLISGCPGRVDIGEAGCFDTGPQWPLNDLYGPAIQALDRSLWTLNASVNTKGLNALIDGKAQSRWTTNTQQAPGQWIEIDLGTSQLINRIELESVGSPNDYPVQWRIEDRTNAAAPTELPAVAEFTGEITRFVIPDTKLQRLRIVQTGSSARWYWSIHELHVGYIAAR